MLRWNLTDAGSAMMAAAKDDSERLFAYHETVCKIALIADRQLREIRLQEIKDHVCNHYPEFVKTYRVFL